MKYGVYLAAVAAAVMAVGFSRPGAAASSQDWPNWRGPSFNGSSEVTGLPVRFSPTEKVRWSTPLPGPSAATPIVYGDHVFLSSIDTEQQTLLAMCLDRKTGQVKWRHVASSGYMTPGAASATHLGSTSRIASSSPVTDGQRVIFFYGQGDLVAYDFNGNKVWARNIQQD